MTAEDRIAQLEATVADQSKQLADLSQRVAELGGRGNFTMNPVSGRNPLLQKYASLGTQVFQSIKAGHVFNDTLGKFWPLVVSKTGSVTLNGSPNHVTTLVFHNTKTAGTDAVVGLGTTLGIIFAPNSTTDVLQAWTFLDRTDTSTGYGISILPWSGVLGTQIIDYINGTGTVIYATGTFQGARYSGLASTTAAASMNIPHGTAPTSPVNGDIWTTTAGLFVRINGVTVGPLT